MSAGSVLTTRFVRHFKVTDLSVSFDQTDLRDPIVHFDALDMPACFSAAVCKASKPYHVGSFMQFSVHKKTSDFSEVLKMVEVTGFEPATFWSRTKRATKLRYTSKMEPMKGLEPLTCGLRNRCSTD